MALIEINRDPTTREIRQFALLWLPAFCFLLGGWLGYRLAASSGTAFAAMVKAVRQSYQCLAEGRMDPFLGSGGADQEMKAAQDTCGLAHLLEIERRTMKEA